MKHCQIANTFPFKEKSFFHKNGCYGIKNTFQRQKVKISPILLNHTSLTCNLIMLQCNSLYEIIDINSHLTIISIFLF